MAEYDSFSRGPFPAGVKSYEFEDASRERTLPIECWYPATDAYKDKDLDRETQDHFLFMEGFPKLKQSAVRDAEMADGAFPLVIFSHGFAGHRRQSTHFCTHLASHGYIVASMDHVGGTFQDITQMVTKVQKGGQLPNIPELMEKLATDRPADAGFTIDKILAGEMGPAIDSDHIGIAGHSFGGWTTLVTTGTDTRIKAALPMAPAGGKSTILPDDSPISKMLTLDWERTVPTLYLVAELDSLLPLDGMKELFGHTPKPKDMVILLNADHFHFCDGVEVIHDFFRKMGGFMGGINPSGNDAPPPMKKAKPSSELCPGKDAYLFAQGVGLAHMDAHLKGNSDALELLKGDIRALLAERGIKVEVIRG